MDHTDIDLSERRGLGWLAAGVVTGLVATLALGGLAWASFGPKEPEPAAPPPQFAEESTVAGIEHVYDGEFTFFVGGGVAVFDCDDDGRQDVFLAGGSNPAALYRNTSPIGGELSFDPLPAATTDLVDVTGAYPIDLDSDSIVDLAVLRLGENVMLRGLGDCRFEPANEDWSVDGGEDWTASFSATWEKGQRLPTLAFGNYLILDDERHSTNTCADSVLMRPTDGGYTSTPLTPGWCTLSVLFHDWDHSGRSDLRMANDRHYYRDGEEQLWRVVEGEPPTLYTREDGWKLMRIWGMGIATYDVTDDGLPEVFLTSQGDNKLQSLAEDATGPEYDDIALGRGATAHRPYAGGDILPSTAWHPEFADVNNDGYVDLYISKGNVEATTEFATNDPSNLLIGQADGTFVEGGEDAGIVDFARARGAALADFNLDGLLDLIQVNRRENVELWRNVGTTTDSTASRHWIALRLRQPDVNPDAIGAWIEVRTDDHTTTRQLTIGGGHAGGQLGWIHFGLGSAESAEVRIRWPDGETGPWVGVDADRFAILERGAGGPEYWEPTGGD